MMCCFRDDATYGQINKVKDDIEEITQLTTLAKIYDFYTSNNSVQDEELSNAVANDALNILESGQTVD